MQRKFMGFLFYDYKTFFHHFLSKTTINFQSISQITYFKFKKKPVKFFSHLKIVALKMILS